MTRHSLLLCCCAAWVATACQAPAMPAPKPVDRSTGEATEILQARPIASPTVGSDAPPETDTARFRGPDECQSGPDFELTYDPSWWGLQATALVHQRLSDCSLLLAAHGQQVAGPKIEERKDLAGFVWQVSHFPSEGLSSYWLESAGGCYLFEASYGAQASAESTAQCQQAADAVIDTFRLMEP